MASSPEWYDGTDTAIAAALSFATDPGTSSAAQTVRLYNSFAAAGGVDTLQDARLIVLGIPSAGADPVADGLEPLDRYYAEARIVSGRGGLTVTATGWAPVGPGVSLSLPAMASGEGVELELRYSPAPDAQAAAVDLVLAVVQGVAHTDDAASMEAGGGIVLGVGDGTTTLLVAGASTLEDPGGASGSVQVGPLVWLYQGVPYSLAEGLQALTPAAAGLARYDLLSLAAGTLTVTSGTETGAALTDDDKPAIPAGEIPLAYVEVDDASTIVQADVADVWIASLYSWSASGLSATLGPGPVALAGSAIVYHSVALPAVLTASSTNRVWLTPAGTLAVTTTAASPMAGAVLLWEATTDGTGVTALRDLRRWTGGRVDRVTFSIPGTLAAAQERYAMAPQRDSYILPVAGLRLALGDPGGTSGQTAVDLEADDGGGFASLAGTDRPPAIAQGAADARDTGARPADFYVPAGARLRLTVDEVPGTASEDLWAEVTLWS